MRRTLLAAAITTAALVSRPPPARAADEYPRTVVATATASSGATSITSSVTIRINRLVEPARRTRVLDGLKYNGYQGFMDALRPLPVIGVISAQGRDVSVKYAWETKVADRVRLIVVSDKPLFFLPRDEAKPRAGYQLTFVELIFDESGGATGTMAGAARVKPAAPDGIVLDDFAIAPVQLTVAPLQK
jgi:hypothetical protein